MSEQERIDLLAAELAESERLRRQYLADTVRLSKEVQQLRDRVDLLTNAIRATADVAGVLR
jgi:hypothetical protein